MFRFASKAVLALLSTAHAAATPGLGGSISQEGVNNAKNVAVPIVFDFIKDVQIPEIDITDGKFTNLDIHIPQPDINNVAMNLNSATNGVELVANQLTTTITSDFTFKYIITVSGKADIKIKNMGVDLELGLSTQPGTPSSELAPMLKVDKSAITINPDDVDITLSGGLVTKIANILIPLIKSSLIPQIVSTVDDTLKSLITGTVDPDLAKYGNEIEIPYLAGVTFDYSQYNGGPKISTDKILAMTLNGTFFNAEKPAPSPHTPAPLPARKATGKTAQGYLTDYVLNTAFDAGFSTGNTLNITALLDKFLNLTVTTDNMGVVIPELLTKYGSGKAVALSGAFVKADSSAKFTADLNTIMLNLAVTVQVEGETAIQAEFDAATIAAIFHTDAKSVITGKISTSTIGTVNNFQTTLGMDATAFSKELQGVVDKYIGEVNQNLTTGVVIPSFMGIAASVDVDCGDGWVHGGVDLTPAHFERLHEMWIEYKTEVDAIRAGDYPVEKYTPGFFETLFLQ